MCDPATDSAPTSGESLPTRPWLFGPGNTASLKHGARSQRVKHGLMPEQAEAFAAIAERRAAVVRDLGGDDAVSTLAGDLVGRYLELSFVADYLRDQIVQHGPLTTKGRQRAALSAWLSIVDRLQRIAVQLGVERKAKPAVPIGDYISQFKGA